jgi:2-oxoisovalerate dehydrogenase E1 component subunit alpha
VRLLRRRRRDERGRLYEALNFCALMKLPAIFVVENNHYGEFTPQSKQGAITQLSARAASYGIPGITVDGQDVVAVYEAARDAIARARAGEGPTLIESNVVRLTPHSSDDDDRRYRPEAEREESRHKDPIDVFSRYLRDHHLLDDEIEVAMRERIRRNVAEALEQADAAESPEPATAFDHVYAGVRVPDFRSRWTS